MLEWYRTDADYLDVLADARGLMSEVCREIAGGSSLCYGGQAIEIGGEWACLTVKEVFLRFAGWDPVARFDADRFDLDLVEKVEPALPADRPWCSGITRRRRRLSRAAARTFRR